MVMIGTQRSGGGLLKKMMREPCDVGKKGVVMKDWGFRGWVEKGGISPWRQCSLDR